MNAKYTYREKNAHDIPVRGMIVRLWSATGTSGRSSIEQMLDPLARTGFVHPYVALMPDWHPGIDAIVGSVVPTRDVLLPNVIGGDIGCGMTAVCLPVSVGELLPKLGEIAKKLRESVPVGTEYNAVVAERVRHNPLWEKELHAPVPSRTLRKLVRQFGSLGGGNHFLELQRDHEDRLWIMLHSGSRYLGVQIRDWYVAEGATHADVDPRKYTRIPYLPAETTLAQNYLSDVQIVMEYARESRREMLIRVMEIVQEIAPEREIATVSPEAIDIGHNFVEQEEYFGECLYVHRKGAIRLRAGDRGLVPGSMGTSSYVVEGRGNEFGFCSCAHGAGRAMSRSAAVKNISERDFRKSMKDIVYEHSALLLDEAPSSYKDIRKVMRGQSDLVKILHELEPILSIKGR